MSKLKVTSVAVAVAAGLILTGCADEGQGWPEPKAAPTVSAPAPPSSPEEIYLRILDDEGIAYSSEDAAVTAGYAVCDFLETGGTTMQAAQLAMDVGIPAWDAGFIVGAANGALCPEVVAA